MSPTYSDGDIVFVAKWAKDFRPGDVVVFHPKFSKSDTFIKRLIANPGSEVMIDNFKVMVDSQPYAESISSPPNWGQRQFECRFSNVYKTGPGEYFVLGDNRCESADSRVLGPISQDSIQGKVIYAIHFK